MSECWTHRGEGGQHVMTSPWWCHVCGWLMGWSSALARWVCHNPDCAEATT